MEPTNRETTTGGAGSRTKLGLALAGDGLRAAFFHLGVLHRLAELDALRRVEVVSTVSGGAIVGAMYALLLKREMERSPDGDLGPGAYRELVAELDAHLVRGARRDLGTRLYTNPVGVLRVLVAGDSLARRMARLYDRHLFRPILGDGGDGGGNAPGEGRVQAGRARLVDLRIRPGGRPIGEEVASYNAKRMADPAGSAITALVVNATRERGVRFRFSCVEVGDCRDGWFRADEAAEVTDRKALLQEREVRELEAALEDGTAAGFALKSSRDPTRTVALSLWWRSRGRPGVTAPQGWESLFVLPGFPGRLPDADPGALRLAKIAAWHLREGECPARDRCAAAGGEAREHRGRLREAVRRMDAELETTLRAGFDRDPSLETRFHDFVLELYWMRVAERASPTLAADLRALTVGEAVSAATFHPKRSSPLLDGRVYDAAFVAPVGFEAAGDSDGLGLGALLDAGCTHVIASDAGRSSDEAMRHGRGRGLPRCALEATGAVRGLAYFNMRSDAGFGTAGGPVAASGVDPEALASVRTDLGALGSVEVAALVNHGYALADRYVRLDLPFLMEAAGAPPGHGSGPPRERPSPPKPRIGGKRVERILRGRGGSAFRPRSARTRAVIALAAAAAMAAVAAVGAAAFGLASSSGFLAAAPAEWLRTWFEILLWPLAAALGGEAGRVGPGGANSGFASPAWIAGVLVAALTLTTLLAVRAPRRQPPGTPAELRRHRRIRAVMDGAWRLKGNLLWLVGPLPLVIAVAGTAVYGAKWLFIGRPSLWATAIHDSDVLPQDAQPGESRPGPSGPRARS